MKVCFILSGTTTSGGATKSFLAFLEFLLKYGHKILVITPDKLGVYEELKNEGIHVEALKYKFNTITTSDKLSKIIHSYVSYIMRWTLNYVSYRKLCRILTDFRPDIIHSNTSVNNLGYLVGRKLGIPHIWHIREYGDLDFKFYVPKLSHMINSPRNYVISITKGIAIHKGIYDSVNSRVIYNGIINEKELLVKPKKNYFLYAGRIEPAKGVLDLIFAYMNYYNSCKNIIPLKIAGDIADRSYYQQIIDVIESSGGCGQIEFLGLRSDIKELMSEAKAIIIPSLNEGFGRVTAEAMAEGCLVIGRNTAGTKEQMDNGMEITGEEIALRFETVEELSNHLETISANDINRYLPMIERAQKCVKELYSSKAYGERIMEFYNQILQNHA